MQKQCSAPKIIDSLLWDEPAHINDKARYLLKSCMAETESKALELSLLDHDSLEKFTVCREPFIQTCLCSNIGMFVGQLLVPLSAICAG